MTTDRWCSAFLGFLMIPLFGVTVKGQAPPSNPNLQMFRDTNVCLRINGFYFPGGVEDGKITGDGTKIEKARWLGSGFIIQTDGTLLTNYHVAQRALGGVAIFDDGSKYDVDQIKKYDSVNDLAVLKIKAQKQFTPAALGDSDTVNPLDEVIAVGNPEGMGLNMTKGQVSQVVRDDHRQPAIIRHTAQIAPGSSGGTLNRGKEVIGVNVSVRLYSEFGTPTGFNDAIPINVAKRLMAPPSDAFRQLSETFNPDPQHMANNKKFLQITARNGQVEAAKTNEPGIAGINGIVLDPLEDYLFVLQTAPGKELTLGIVNQKDTVIACSRLSNSDLQPILYSNDYRQEVIVAVFNGKNYAQNYGFTIYKIKW
jgi:S1-C subfamily serine protease